MCCHCGMRPRHPRWRHCQQCYDTVQARFLDFPCDVPDDCPHLVEPRGCWSQRDAEP